MSYPTSPFSPQPIQPNAPASPPGFLASISLWTKIRFVFGIVGAVVAGAFYLYITHRNAENMVLFENSLDAAAELSIDGSSKGQLGPRQHMLVSLSAGAHKVTLRGPKGTLEEGTLDVPRKETFGYRALYVLGAKSGVAVVTKYYGKDAAFEDSVAVVPPGTRLVELPGTSVMKAIDEPFPASIRTTKNAMSPSVTRVCHVNAKGQPTCPGW